MTLDGMAAMGTDIIDLDDHTAWLVQHLAVNGPASAEAATALTIEKLRRLEDLARNAGADRQAFQKILFSETDIAINPVPKALQFSEAETGPAA